MGDSDLVLAPVGEESVTPITIAPDATATIGRDTDCQVKLDDSHVSRQHACLARRDDAWLVTDLGSHNGTFLNESRLAPNEPAVLRNGDILRIGLRRFHVTRGGAGAPRPLYDNTRDTRASLFLRLRDDSKQELGWQEFRDRYAPVITGYCRQAGLAAADGDDILQEVMMGFFRRAADFVYDPSKGRFRGYLKRATLNAIRKRGRRAGGPRLVSEDWLDEHAEATETRWEQQWTEQLLVRALDEVRSRFDAKTIEAFELYCRRDVPAPEVAGRLDISVDSVHQAKSRVSAAIREVMEGLRAEEG